MMSYAVLKDYKKDKILKAYKNLKSGPEKKAFLKTNNLTSNQLKNWNRPKRRKRISENASKRSTKHFVTTAATRAKRKLGKFDNQEKKLFREFKIRRAKGLVVDGEWFRSKMKMLVKEGDDPNKDNFKASNKWIGGFNKRFGITLQRKTNSKSKSLTERLPKIKNFHWYAIYQMALEPP